MKLENRIKSCIIQYPEVFDYGDKEQSTLAVLNHLFLVQGSGYAWTDKGYLMHHAEVPEYPQCNLYFDEQDMVWKIGNSPFYGTMGRELNHVEMDYKNRVSSHFFEITDSVSDSFGLPQESKSKLLDIFDLSSLTPNLKSDLYIPPVIQEDYKLGYINVLNWAKDFDEKHSDIIDDVILKLMMMDAIHD